jgi:TPR repeat protein
LQGGDSPLYFGVMYARGDGVVKHLDEAVTWFRRVEEQWSIRGKECLKSIKKKGAAAY